MAVMASPQPERHVMDSKIIDAVSEKDLKSEVNGHTSPPEAVVQSGIKAIVNGNGKHDESEIKNGTSGLEDVDDTPTKELAASESVATKSNIASDTAEPTKTVSPAEKETAQVEKPPAPAAADLAEDVEMADAINGDEKPEVSIAQPTSIEEPAAEASEPAKSTEASNEDVEMGQDLTEELPSTTKVNGTEEVVVVQTSITAIPPAVEVDLHPESMSQLAIDAKEDLSSPAAESEEVSMIEASAPAAKVAREREDDVSDEPAAKRAKTDSQEDDAAELPKAEPMDTHKSEGDESKDLSELHKIERWIDAEVDSKPLTAYQAREYRRVLAGVKKTKSGGNFKDSVEKMWPTLWNSYIMKIDKPMDIGELERRLRDGAYSILSDFKKDLALIYGNSLAFNGPGNDITNSGYQVVETIWQRIRDIPAEEPPKSKPPPKQMPSRTTEPRNPPPPPPRRQSSAAAPSPATKPPPEADLYAVPPGGVPQVRRASTQIDSDRPKRAIHPPKNRDPDYTSKTFNKKKLSLEMQFCYEVVTDLMDQKHSMYNIPFLNPVDPVALQIPNYFDVIKHPMDLSTIVGNLERGSYQTAKQVQTDVNLVFKNCFKFNQPGQPVYIQGQELQSLFKAEWAKKQQWIAKNTPGKADSADASSQGSEDGSEDEEDTAAPANDTPATNANIQMLERKLVEETQKLSELYMSADTSSETMIGLQQDVLSAIRGRLIAEKKKLAEKKPEKSAKAKPAKAAKPKAGGAASSKRANAAAAPKKSGAGGGNKKSGKRTMSGPEKDQIATAINELDSPYIERAIDIIKKDTGQAENSSGELELEIDQLSNDALHKLWDLCKKTLPNFGTREAPPARDSSPVNSGPTAKQAHKSSKPKKNKPMNALEQEARIAELEKLRKIYDAKQKADAAGGDADAADETREQEVPLHGEESESSDSEEE